MWLSWFFCIITWFCCTTQLRASLVQPASLHHLFCRRLVERLVKDCGADVNSKVARQCEPFFVEAIVEVTTVSGSCILIILLFDLLCVCVSVNLYLFTVYRYAVCTCTSPAWQYDCSCRIRSQNQSFFIGYLVGPKEISSAVHSVSWNHAVPTEAIPMPARFAPRIHVLEAVH